MFSLSRATALLTVGTAFLAATVQALPKVSRSGRYLYSEDGSRFYIKGIAYQEQGNVVASPDNPFGEPSDFIDPLSLPSACQRDVPFLQQLGVNTVRVYSVNASLNHDACMSAFDAAGIYTIIDLALPLNGSIDRLAPSWGTNLLNQYIQTIDVFSKYNNVLAYNIGNEVVVSDTTQVAPYVKAAARDIKAYLKSKNSNILVGYAAINGASGWRGELADYLSCDLSGTNSDATSIDLYGLNDYSWCGASSFQGSYAGTYNDFLNYNVAAYLSEFGCISSPPRLWTETEAIFSTQMNTVWSGGIAFSYFPAQSAAGQFGMVTISSDGSTVTTSPDFDRLVTEYGKVDFTSINSPSQSSATATYPACQGPSSDFLASNTLPPTPNAAACNCLESTLSCQFTPATANYSAIAGQLTDTGCSLLGQAGGSCTDIGGDGQTGVYGSISGCDPTVKLSWVMTQYYDRQNRNPQACNFAGNATVNSNAPTSLDAANAAASSCISNPNAIFTPSGAPPAPTLSPKPTSGGGNNGGKNNTGGAAALTSNNHVLVGITLATLTSVIGAAWTLF